MVRAFYLTSTLILALLFSACHKKPATPFVSDLKMSDPNSERQLIAGFYQLEQNQWRWAARRFAVVLKPPPGSERTGAILQLKLFIPESHIAELGPMTLSADVGEVSLLPEKFTKGDSFTYRREVPASSVGPNLLPVVFSFDKALEPYQTDGRELAAVVSEVSLQPRKPTASSAEALATNDDTKRPLHY